MWNAIIAVIYRFKPNAKRHWNSGIFCLISILLYCLLYYGILLVLWRIHVRIACIIVLVSLISLTKRFGQSGECK